MSAPIASLLVVLLASAAPPAPDATAPHDRAVAGMVDSVVTARWVRVHLGWTDWVSVPFSTTLPCHLLRERSLGETRLGPDGVKRFVEALDLVRRPPSTRPGPRAGCTPDSGHSRPDIWVAFEGRGERTRVKLNPESGAASFEKRDALRGSLLLLDRTRSVRRLLAEVFPNTPELDSIPWCETTAPDTGATPPSESPDEKVPVVSVRVPAEYPEDARNSGVDGTVWIQVLVGVDGRPKETCIRTSITMLDESAVRSVEQWQFRPATVDGVPKAVWVVLPIRFTLH